jgi:hypothetical protein
VLLHNQKKKSEEKKKQTERWVSNDAVPSSPSLSLVFPTLYFYTSTLIATLHSDETSKKTSPKKKKEKKNYILLLDGLTALRTFFTVCFAFVCVVSFAQQQLLNEAHCIPSSLCTCVVRFAQQLLNEAHCIPSSLCTCVVRFAQQLLDGLTADLLHCVSLLTVSRRQLCCVLCHSTVVLYYLLHCVSLLTVSRRQLCCVVLSWSLRTFFMLCPLPFNCCVVFVTAYLHSASAFPA